MLSKSDLAFIRSLSKSSERRIHGLFVAEGIKLVHDMLGSFACALLVAKSKEYAQLSEAIERLPSSMRPVRCEIVNESFDFGKISSLKSPQPTLALFLLPELKTDNLYTSQELALLLDNVQDPGNLGTIIRTADWFGISHVVLSSGCADPFSPKVVQATMGALCRVRTPRLHGATSEFLSQYRGQVYGTFLDGEPIYQMGLSSNQPEGQLLVMGNEGNGISPEVERYISKRIYIPPYSSAGMGSESLNVAIATAICLSEFRREMMK
ncbi:MAG: RNA methyltransferase [Porphyromonadaceae bacterium]|nr:RNA methyltransferase [Porphyromonadaceae bacterium]